MATPRRRPGGDIGPTSRTARKCRSSPTVHERLMSGYKAYDQQQIAERASERYAPATFRRNVEMMLGAH